MILHSPPPCTPTSPPPPPVSLFHVWMFCDVCRSSFTSAPVQRPVDDPRWRINPTLTDINPTLTDITLIVAHQSLSPQPLTNWELSTIARSFLLYCFAFLKIIFSLARWTAYINYSPLAAWTPLPLIYQTSGVLDIWRLGPSLWVYVHVWFTDQVSPVSFVNHLSTFSLPYLSFVHVSKRNPWSMQWK